MVCRVTEKLLQHSPAWRDLQRHQLDFSYHKLTAVIAYLLPLFIAWYQAFSYTIRRYHTTFLKSASSWLSDYRCTVTTIELVAFQNYPPPFFSIHRKKPGKLLLFDRIWHNHMLQTISILDFSQFLCENVLVFLRKGAGNTNMCYLVNNTCLINCPVFQVVTLVCLL